MDVSCKRWHSRAQTKLVPGRVESALLHFWTQCEGSKHCNKWILILTTPLNAILRNLELKLFLEKRYKCVLASTTSVHVARATWVDYSENVSKTPQLGLSPKLLLPKLEPFGDLAADQWGNMMECVMQYVTKYHSIDCRIQTLSGKSAPLSFSLGGLLHLRHHHSPRLPSWKPRCFLQNNW